MATVAQINATLQTALRAVGYSNSTTSAQAIQDLTSVSTNVTALNTSVQGLPTSNIGITQVMAVVPQGITLAVSAVRTTSSIKNLSAPITAEEGTAVLAIVQNIRAQLIAALNAYIIRIPAVEIVIPGLSRFALTTLQNLADPLIRAIIAATPPNIPQSTIQEIQSSIRSAIQNALSKAPA